MTEKKDVKKLAAMFEKKAEVKPVRGAVAAKEDDKPKIGKLQVPSIFGGGGKKAEEPAPPKKTASAMIGGASSQTQKDVASTPLKNTFEPKKVETN